MKKYRKTYHHRNGRRKIRCLVPYETIEAAIDGDAAAINAIAEHYGGYILRLAEIESYTSGGRNYIIVDKTKSDIMKFTLAERIPKFKSVH